jgi:hypothetical protein
VNKAHLSVRGYLGLSSLGWIRAITLGFFLSSLLAAVYTPKPPNQRLERTSLTRLELGVADQPFVRRQLVPYILHVVDSSMSQTWRASEENRLRQSPFWGRHLNWTESEGGDLDEVECIFVWTVFLATFLAVLNREMRVYSGVSSSSVYAWAFDFAVCLCVFAIFHRFLYVYDPPTLTFSALALRELRKERLLPLILITVFFSLNRETAFLVPGLAFFYWVHTSKWIKAISWSALLGVCYVMIVALITYHFRSNPGVLAENHRMYLMRVYTHERLGLAVAALAGLIFYAIEVFRRWRSLPVILKAMQWFIPVWLFMHVMWGFPMEWRTFLEVFPGIILTIVALWTVRKKGREHYANA